ncbi:MAG TPA: response regulator [Candidatus Deferrimicrobium sp.]|nr:response regulator [Candidatus Deferrimicrobium sp.]
MSHADTRQTGKGILIADGQAGVRGQLREYLTDIGYTVEMAADGREAVQRIADGSFAVALVDCRLADGDGLDVLEQLCQSHPDLSVVMLSGDPSLELVISALRRGAFDFVVKPVNLTEVDVIVRKAWDSFELRAAYRALSYRSRLQGAAHTPGKSASVMIG